MERAQCYTELFSKQKKTGIKATYVSFQSFGKNSLELILKNIQVQIASTLGISLTKDNQLGSKFSTVESDFLDFILDIKESLVIAFDEVDCLELTNEMGTFFGILRATYESSFYKPHPNKIFFIVSSFGPPRDYIKDSTASPFNIGNSYQLSNFTLSESTNLLMNIEPPITQDEIKLVWNFTGGQPYLINYAGHLINNANSVHEALNKIETDTFDFYFNSVHSILDKNNKAKQALKKFILDGKINFLDALELVDSGILVKKGNEFGFSCGLYQILISKYYEF